jgi:hypothetical protein
MFGINVLHLTHGLVTNNNFVFFNNFNVFILKIKNIILIKKYDTKHILYSVRC